ncbi:hypothetical protein J6590_006599 [Homalodisca vitripennis]|nr:hypothetical protein J6590_006599 [Homalodisca vitripennis]
MKCKSWGRQREIGNDKCSQKLCSKTSIRFWSPNIPGTRETQKRRPRPSSISIGRLSSRPLVRPAHHYFHPFPRPRSLNDYIATRRPPPISSTRSRISFPGDRSDTSSRVSFTNFPTNYLLPGKNYNSRDSPYHCFLSGDSTGILYPRLPFINTFFPPTPSS